MRQVPLCVNYTPTFLRLVADDDWKQPQYSSGDDGDPARDGAWPHDDSDREEEEKRAMQDDARSQAADLPRQTTTTSAAAWARASDAPPSPGSGAAAGDDNMEVDNAQRQEPGVNLLQDLWDAAMAGIETVKAGKIKVAAAYCFDDDTKPRAAATLVEQAGRQAVFTCEEYDFAVKEATVTNGYPCKWEKSKVSVGGVVWRDRKQAGEPGAKCTPRVHISRHACIDAMCYASTVNIDA